MAWLGLCNQLSPTGEVASVTWRWEALRRTRGMGWEDTRNGMSPEVLEVSGWGGAGFSAGSFFPCGFLPGACLGHWGSVWGSVTTAEDTCPHVLPCANISPVALCGWHCFGGCYGNPKDNFGTSEKRNSPDSGNLNPLEAFSNEQEFLREKCCCPLRCVEDRKRWPDKDGSKKFGSYFYQLIEKLGQVPPFLGGMYWYPRTAIPQGQAILPR